MALILVVDDDAAVRTLVSLSLHQLGHETRCAEDGLEALHLLDHERFDLVLTDVDMPRLDGLQLMARIASTHRQLRVLVMSAFPENEVRAFENDAAGYLSKPFGLRQLAQSIQAALEEGRAPPA